MSGQWKGSTRTMPPGWQATRARILRRDGHRCTATLPSGERCPNPATDVDHVVPHSQGGSDDDTNLTSLCHDPHHLAKSSAEGVAAQRRRTRPPRKHPGLID